MNKEASYKNLGGINVISSDYTTGPTEFLDIRNMGFVRPGALTSRPGQETLLAISSSTLLVKPTTQMEYVRENGETVILYDSGQTLYNLAGTAVGTSLTSSATLGLTIDYVVQNDFLFFANGHRWMVFGGTIAVNYASNSATVGSGYGGFLATFHTGLTPTNGVTAVIPPGAYYFFLSPARGPQSLISQYGLPGISLLPEPKTNQLLFGLGALVTLTATVASMGRWLMYGFDMPQGYGYSAVAVQYQRLESMTYDANDRILNTLKSTDTYAFRASTWVGGNTALGIEFDHYTLSADWENQYAITTMPRYLETYNNMLFACGFSAQPVKVLFSEIGEPERIKEENFFEIRTKDNNPITGCMFFQDSLLFFKKRSIHELIGTSPQELVLKTINLEYGALNNEGIVVFQNKLWFVDEKGICEYNASNIRTVSEPIETYLDQVDKTKIKALHYKDRNEVWFCADNKCFVYDYFSNAWTIYDNIPIDRTSGAIVLPNGANFDPYYWRTDGSYQQRVRFGQTLASDFGQNITLVAKTRFHKAEGDSLQKLFRRLYIDTECATLYGGTFNFSQDYGSSVVLTKSTTLVSFQERVDFGISARAVSVEMIIKAGLSFTVNGYTIESRLLRSV